MAIQEQARQVDTAVVEAEESTYERLCQLVNIQPVGEPLGIDAFHNAVLADVPLEKRLTAALQVFLDLAARSGQQVERIDKTLIDQYIARLDAAMSEQLDLIMH